MVESDQPETGARLGVTEADAIALNSIPAQYANKFYVTSLDVGMRITFGEGNPATSVTSFRNAVFLSYNDVAILADLLQNQLSLVKDAFLAANEQAGKSGEKS
jgi:hypothetical protein